MNHLFFNFKAQELIRNKRFIFETPSEEPRAVAEKPKPLTEKEQITAKLLTEQKRFNAYMVKLETHQNPEFKKLAKQFSLTYNLLQERLKNPSKDSTLQELRTEKDILRHK